MQKETTIRDRKMTVTKVTIQRPITLTDPAVWDPDGGEYPPEFATGDKVAVTVPTAQHLVGSGAATYVDEDDANPPDLEKGTVNPDALASEDVPTAATVEAPETTTNPKAATRKAAR